MFFFLTNLIFIEIVTVVIKIIEFKVGVHDEHQKSWKRFFLKLQLIGTEQRKHPILLALRHIIWFARLLELLECARSNERGVTSDSDSSRRFVSSDALDDETFTVDINKPNSFWAWRKKSGVKLAHILSRHANNKLTVLVSVSKTIYKAHHVTSSMPISEYFTTQLAAKRFD